MFIQISSFHVRITSLSVPRCRAPRLGSRGWRILYMSMGCVYEAQSDLEAESPIHPSAGHAGRLPRMSKGACHAIGFAHGQRIGLLLLYAPGYRSVGQLQAVARDGAVCLN
eukprot:6203220-Pleurochrysis_carterae.AAC.3